MDRKWGGALMTRYPSPLTAALLLLAACGSDAPDETLTREDLLDPATCKKCHATHYEQWSSSMHAYASEDPVFKAMNRRGQEEAALGEFCIRCHAPVALLEGKTFDGLNLDEVPKKYRGVTCYFCHNASDVEIDHPKLANDATMRGGIRDPVDPKVHGAAYSEFHDRNSVKSSVMCGRCHDFYTPNRVFLERTLFEYEQTIFSKVGTLSFDTCQGCHMEGQYGVVANVAGVPARRIHDHVWPAVDVALTDFPHRDAMRAAVEECALRNSIQFFSFEPNTSSVGSFTATLETSAGHNQPSGAAQDRRMWLEVVAYDDKDQVIYESGKLADDESETSLEDGPNPVWTMHEKIYDAEGKQVHMFWEAAPSDAWPEGHDDRALPGAKTAIAGGHSLSFTYQLPVFIPRRVEFTLLIRPIGLDVLQDLVDSGHLDGSILAEMPTFTVYSAIAEWTPGTGDPSDFKLTPTLAADCKRWRCLYDAKGEGCAKE
jgi:hypothetical protein